MQQLYTTDPLQIWRFLRFMLWVCLILGPVSCFWRIHRAHQELAHDQVALANLAAVERLGQPIVAALDRYHAEHGYYPAALDDLDSSAPLAPGFHYYSHWLPDDLLASSECAERAKRVQGWSILQPESERLEVERFVRECVQGVRSYGLQSADFPAAADPTLERYGYYDPAAGRWILAWCQSKSGRNQTSLGSLGFCDHHRHAPIDYTARLASN